MDRESYRQSCAQEFEREQAARKLHWRTTVVLGYNNIPLRITPHGFDPAPILGRDSLAGTSLARLCLGGIKVIVWSPGIPFWKPSGEGLAGRAKVRFLQQQLEAMHELGKLTGGQLQVARNTREIREVNASGGVAIVLHLSGANHLNDLAILREYYDLGVRMVHCGFQDWPEDDPAGESVQYGDPHRRLYHATKLGPHGVRTVEEMKRLGIIVDVAHLLPEGFDDVVSRMEGLPFVYSHGGCGALAPNERTFDDARIAKVAANRGVYGIGVCHVPDLSDLVRKDEGNEQKHALIAERRAQREREMAASASDIRDYLRQRYSEWSNWEERELARLNGYQVKLSLATIVAHMKYLRDRFGPDIVGYGPDYEHTYQYLRGLEEADKTPNLTRALLDEGFCASEVQGAMGHNFMRVFEAVLG